MEIQKYGRFWAVWDGEDLVCVTVYKRGAAEVARRLNQGGANYGECKEEQAGSY